MAQNNVVVLPHRVELSERVILFEVRVARYGVHKARRSGAGRGAVGATGSNRVGERDCGADRKPLEDGAGVAILPRRRADSLRTGKHRAQAGGRRGDVSPDLHGLAIHPPGHTSRHEKVEHQLGVPEQRIDQQLFGRT